MVLNRPIIFKEPKDVRRAVAHAINQILQDKPMPKASGQLAGLAHVWLKAWEIDKIAELEKRIKALENAQESKK